MPLSYRFLERKLVGSPVRMEREHGVCVCVCAWNGVDGGRGEGGEGESKGGIMYEVCL